MIGTNAGRQIAKRDATLDSSSLLRSRDPHEVLTERNLMETSLRYTANAGLQTPNAKRNSPVQIQTTEAHAPEVTKPPTPLWFKEAIVYQLHIKTFCDANNDGIGDFQGLLSKLDYLKNLGVTAICFYRSTRRRSRTMAMTSHDIGGSIPTMAPCATSGGWCASATTEVSG